jgi:cytochrome P450
MKTTGCPVDAGRDDRKSARLATENLSAEPGSRLVQGFAEARDILRRPGMLQAGIGAEQVKVSNPAQGSVFFLDGELHRQRRTAIARYFTPKAISTRYRAVMEQTTDELIAELRAKGTARLDLISFQLAANVAAEIIGLTNSPKAPMAERIRRTLDSGGGTYRLGPVAGAFGMATAISQAILFYLFDVRPAISARRKAPREDVISHMVAERYSLRAMLIECLTYGAAGMVTTREFIVMAAWHLLERDDLRATFLAGGEAEQIALLEEILRLEPIASILQRRAGDDVPADGRVVAGELYAVDVRAANTDESATGPCPHAIDPERASRTKGSGAYLSFGDGPHRCPGAQVALHESRIFLDRLLRVPGIALARAPQMRWRSDLMSYELRDAVVTCERV